MRRETIYNVCWRKRSSSERKIHSVFIILLLIALSAPALAETKPGSYSISPFVGGYLFRREPGSEPSSDLWSARGVRFHRALGCRAPPGVRPNLLQAHRCDHRRLSLPVGGVIPFSADRQIEPFSGGRIRRHDDRLPGRQSRQGLYGYRRLWSRSEVLVDPIRWRSGPTCGTSWPSAVPTITWNTPSAWSSISADPRRFRPRRFRPFRERRRPCLPGLPAPTNLTATPVSDSRINLDWNATPGATGYKVYRDGSYLTAVRTTSVPDTGLKADTRYCYAVSATDDTGRESGRSNQACATTLKPAAGAGERKRSSGCGRNSRSSVCIRGRPFRFRQVQSQARGAGDPQEACDVAEQQSGRLRSRSSSRGIAMSGAPRSTTWR